jgi:hypothetical protein
MEDASVDPGLDGKASVGAMMLDKEARSQRLMAGSEYILKIYVRVSSEAQNRKYAIGVKN